MQMQPEQFKLDRLPVCCCGATKSTTIRVVAPVASFVSCSTAWTVPFCPVKPTSCNVQSPAVPVATSVQVAGSVMGAADAGGAIANTAMRAATKATSAGSLSRFVIESPPSRLTI
jgi:hypothetical protein